jgi:hypothetical protein
MLEEMGEAGLARLDFVTRTCLYRDLDSNDVGIVRRDDDDAQAVIEVALEVRYVEYLAGFSRCLGRCLGLWRVG